MCTYVESHLAINVHYAVEPYRVCIQVAHIAIYIHSHVSNVVFDVATDQPLHVRGLYIILPIGSHGNEDGEHIESYNTSTVIE